MNSTPTATIRDVEARNDALARENDIDAYYSQSSILVRYTERRRLRCVARMTAAAPGDRILEVGCGGGHVLRLFPESDLVGVDVSQHMLDKARRNLRGYRVQLLKGELRHLHLPVASFDRIICTEVLEHVDDPEELLDQMARLLRPDGRIVITLPNDHLVNRLRKIVNGLGFFKRVLVGRISWGADQYHVHIWRPEEMRALISRCFTIQQERFAPHHLVPLRCCFQCVTPRASTEPPPSTTLVKPSPHPARSTTALTA